jgi:hypothetical protein
MCGIKGKMKKERKKILSPVRREQAGDYMLTSLVAFAVTIIVTRVFLALTGYPQIGNEVLHFAHALWGGLLLIIAFMLPLAYANRWAIQTSALLGGVGVGLFIDEVGKFITQANDYFYPPALPLIYGFILLNALVYIYFRRPQPVDPRNAMYQALNGLQDALDGDLDEAEEARIEAQLAVARSSDRMEIASLADAIQIYLAQEKYDLLAVKPSIWRRLSNGVDAFGKRMGRRAHRNIITGALILWVVFVIGYIAFLIQGGTSIDLQVLQWRGALVTIQGIIGSLMIIAITLWLLGNEEQGLNFAVLGFLLALVALQTFYFYISQFSAITATLLQLAFLQILLTYRRWYLANNGD